MGAAAATVDGKVVFLNLNAPAERILAEVPAADREAVEDVVRRAGEILAQATGRDLSEEARRRMMNAVGAVWTR